LLLLGGLAWWTLRDAGDPASGAVAEARARIEPPVVATDLAPRDPVVPALPAVASIPATAAAPTSSPALPSVAAAASLTSAPRGALPPPTALAAPASLPRPAREEGVTPAAPPAPEPLACVGIRSLSAPAEVWWGDRRLGTTRDKGCHAVPAGTHEFVLRGDMIRERRVTLTLAPGETRDPVVVELDPAPARVRFPSRMPDTCVVLVDDVARGTLGALDHQVQIDRPDRPHEIVVSCDGVRQSDRWPRFDYPEVWFEPSGSP
jgi:hypothetical protein